LDLMHISTFRPSTYYPQVQAPEHAMCQLRPHLKKLVEFLKPDPK
jgi:hypothetical protein